MKKLSNILPFVEKKIYYLALFFGVLLLATYYQRNPTGDDAWFAEQSYYFWKEGKIRSTFFTGLLDWDQYLYVSHKLFLWIGAAFMALFGVSSYVSKLFGVFSLLLLILFAYFYCYYLQKNTKLFAWFFLLLVANSLVGGMSFENRPDIFLGALGFGSFTFLLAATSHKSKTAWQIVLAAILAGLAPVAHLNGLIYGVAGLLYLGYKRQYLYAIYFSVVAGGVFGLYFVDILANQAWHSWWYQLRNDPATQNSFGVWAKVKTMLFFFNIFVESPEQLVTTLLLLTIISVDYYHLSTTSKGADKYFWAVAKNLILNNEVFVYLSGLLLVFWGLTKSATGIYQMLFLPFMCMGIANYLAQDKPKEAKKMTSFVSLALLIYFLVGFIGNVQRIGNNFSNDFKPKVYKEIAKEIPQGSTLIVPLTMFFNEYPHYKVLSHTGYQVIHKNQCNETSFAAWLDKHNVEYIILDEDKLSYCLPTTPNKWKNYNLIKKIGEISVWKRE